MLAGVAGALARVVMHDIQGGLRITVTATHETADIELLADALEEAAGASQVSAAGDRLRDAVRAAEPVSQHMSAS